MTPMETFEKTVLARASVKKLQWPYPREALLAQKGGVFGKAKNRISKRKDSGCNPVPRAEEKNKKIKNKKVKNKK